MDSVKEEKYSLCQACLSIDRARTPLGDHFYTYLQLIGASDKYANRLSKDILVCWECTARLRSIRTFQNRIKNAQNILQQYIYNLNELPKPLSNLKTKIIDNFDNSQQNDLSDVTIETQNAIIDIKVEKKIEVEIPPIIDNEDNEVSGYDNETIDYGNESTDYGNDVIDSDNKLIDTKDILFENDDRLRDTKDDNLFLDQIPVKIEEDGKKEKKIKRKIKSESLRRYEKYAKIDKLLKISGEDLHKWYKKIKLSAKEMEDMLDKDRSYKSTWIVENKCKDCGAEYRRLLDLKRHIAFRHSKTNDTFECSHCHLKCTSHSDLKKHWILVHTCIYTCVVCDVMCRDTKGVARHVIKEHGSVYTCNECGVARSTLQSFSEHYKEFHTKAICDYCGNSFRKKITLIRHIQHKHAPPFCELCNRMFQNHKALTRHRYSVHEITVHGPRPRDLTCSECGEQFPNVHEYRRHLSMKHQQDEKNVAKNHTCEICNTTYTTRVNLRKHMDMKHVTHSTEDAYCVQCDIQFMNIHMYRHHITTSVKHAKERKGNKSKPKVECPECGKIYTRKQYMMNHYNLMHRNDSKYCCGECDKKFLNRTKYMDHMKYYHAGMQRVKDKICDICGRGFAARKTLIHHINTHNGEKPYQCEYCSSRFIQKYAMQTHVKHVHENMKRPGSKKGTYLCKRQ